MVFNIIAMNIAGCLRQFHFLCEKMFPIINARTKTTMKRQPTKVTKQRQHNDVIVCIEQGKEKWKIKMNKKTESRGVNSYRLRNNYFIVCSFQMWYNVFIHFSFQLYCSPFRCVFSHFPSIILLVSSRMLYTTAYIAFIRDGDYCVVFAFFGFCLYEFKKKV